MNHLVDGEWWKVVPDDPQITAGTSIRLDRFSLSAVHAAGVERRRADPHLAAQ